MTIRDTVRRAGRSLRQAKARTLLTSLAIAVGAFTIVLSLAAGEGGRQYAEDIVSANTDVRELYVQMEQDGGTSDPSAPREYTDDPTVNYGGGFSMRLLSDDDIRAIAEVEGVESVVPYYNVTIKYITREGQKKYTSGVEPYQPTIQLEYAAGSGDKLDKNSIIIPDTLRKVLGFDSPSAAIGQMVEIAIDTTGDTPFESREVIHEYEIVGVNKTSALAVADGSASVRLHNDAAKELYQAINAGSPTQNTYMAATVTAEDGADVEVVKGKIQDKGDYLAQTAEDAMSFLFQFINVLQSILIGFGALATLTAVFGIINTQYISVLERTQQIGLMKALGMKRREVGRLFRLEAAWIGFLGGTIGAGAAVAAGAAANPFISDALNLGETRLLIFSLQSAAAVVVGLMIISVVAGILPARKAAKLDPIEALRTE